MQNEFTWEEFTAKLCEQFGERNRVDTIKEFNKLRQTRSVDMYLKRFEYLRSCMTQQNPHLTKAYFVSSFLSWRLSEDIRRMVKMIRPQIVEQAAESARLQEMIVEALMKKQRQQHNGLMVGLTNRGVKYVNREVGKSGGGMK